MNTAVDTTRTGQDNRPREHPPQPEERAYRNDLRRVGLLDRIALHLGVALIAWGRRPLSVESRERRANRIEQHVATLERELAAERMRSLSAPRL